MNVDLSNEECDIVERWRRQYRQRWLACGLFGTCAVVGASVSTYLLLHIVSVLHNHEVPFLHALTLNWFQYLGEAATSRLLACLSLAAMMMVTSAGVVTFLIGMFRISFRRYRLMEKLLRAGSTCGTTGFPSNAEKVAEASSKDG